MNESHQDYPPLGEISFFEDWVKGPGDVLRPPQKILSPEDEEAWELGGDGLVRRSKMDDTPLWSVRSVGWGDARMVEESGGCRRGNQVDPTVLGMSANVKPGPGFASHAGWNELTGIS